MPCNSSRQQRPDLPGLHEDKYERLSAGLSSVCCVGASIKVSRRRSATKCCRSTLWSTSKNTTMRQAAVATIQMLAPLFGSSLLQLGGFVIERVSLHFNGSAIEFDSSQVASLGGNSKG